MKSYPALIAIAAVALLTPLAAHADPPTTLVQQGRVLTDTGPLVGSDVEVTYTLETIEGEVVYTEVDRVNFTDGYYTAVLGDNPTGDRLEDVIADGRAFDLWISIEGGGRMGPHQIHAVAYAFQARSVTGDVTADSLTFRASDGSTKPVLDGNGAWVGGIECTNCIGSVNVTDGSLSSADLGVDAVGSEEIQNSAVGTSEIADGAVAASKIAAGAVSHASIQDNAVELVNMANDSVGTAEIVNGSVASADLRDGSVGNIDLAGDAVTSDKIANGTIQPEDFAGVFLYSKSQIVPQTATISIPAGSTRQPTASCADANDIPLTMSCEVTTLTHAVQLRSIENANWASGTAAASTTCEFYNDAPSGNANAQAIIYCLSVP